MESYSPTPPTIDLLSSNCNRSCSLILCLTFNTGDWVSGGATSLWPFPLDVRFLYQAKSSPSGFSQSPSTRQLCLCRILNSWPCSCVTKHWIACACSVWSWEYLRLSDSGLLSAPSLGTVLCTSSFPLGCLLENPWPLLLNQIWSQYTLDQAVREQRRNSPFSFYFAPKPACFCLLSLSKLSECPVCMSVAL